MTQLPLTHARALPRRVRAADTARVRHRVARRTPWFELYTRLPLSAVAGLGLLAWALFVGLWQLAAGLGWVNAALVPGPFAVGQALYELFAEQGFLKDVGISVYRVGFSFAIACAVAVPLGLFMGAFPAVEAFVNPLVSPARYLPAPSFIPLLLMWFGAGENQKLALLLLGVIFFLITAVMDQTQLVPRDLVEASRVLGASRKKVLARVVIPASLPGVVTAMRQMLAVSWTYLVIAEIVAADTGIGAMIMRAKRFIRTDDILAGIVVIGVLGLTCDLSFRLAHRWLFPYLYLKR